MSTDLPMSTWRRELGLTQSQAAEVLERSRRLVQCYELGEKPIPRMIRYAMSYLLEHPEALAGHEVGDRRRRTAPEYP